MTGASAEHDSGSKLPTRFLAILATAALAASACLVTPVGNGTSKGIIKIGSDFPTCTAGGQATENGVRFALQQIQSAGGIRGFTLQYEGFDDCRQGEFSPDAGTANVRRMLADAAFLGMVGPYNSDVALAEIPVAAPQRFTMVSPSNTNPCLTKNLVICPVPHPQKLRGGNPNNYFRVATTDDNQGPSMADYAFLKMNLRKVGVLDDSTARGVSHANAFEAEFTKLGGTTMRASYRKDNTRDWTPILLAFRESGAAGVYAGGDADQNICMSRRQMTDIGWVAPFLSWEGINFTRCIDDAATNSVGMYFTSAVPNAARIPGAASAIAAFQKAFPGPSDFGFFTMDAYDATNMLVRAIERAIGDAGGKMPSREQVRAEMAKTKDFVGVMGTYSFDQNGDTTLEIMSVYMSKQVNDPSLSIGVCGSNAKNICYTWFDQFDLAKTKA